MKTIITTFLFSATLLFGAHTMAGAGHEHDAGGGHSHGPITSNAAAKKATDKMIQLAKAGKIDASWAQVKASNVEQKTYSEGPEWVVTFKNSKVKDTSKQTLYFFFSLDGHYIAGNYTGN